MPKSAAISDSDEAMPAAPQSCNDSTSADETSSTDDSMSFLPVNGSPTWTDGRFSDEPSSSSWLASTEAPPMPSRPVVAPYRTTSWPATVAFARMSRSTGSSPTHIAFTRQLSRYDSSNTASPPTVGTPTQLP